MGTAIGYKYEQVASQLHEWIAAGRYPDGRLPREVDLVTELGVSRVTVNRALQRLAGRGILRRVKKQGTFVVGHGDDSLSLLHQVGVVMRSRGHFYNSLWSSLCRQLMHRGLFPVTIDPYHGDEQDARGRLVANPDFPRAVQRLLGAPVRGLVFDGAGYQARPFLAGHEDKRAVCIHCFDAPGIPPPHAVFADYAGSIRLAVEHLLGLGHREIALFGVLPAAQTPAPGDPRNDPLQQMRGAYLETMQAAGLAGHSEVVLFSDRPRPGTVATDDEVRGFLARPRRPTAIVCEMDYLAVKVVMRAMELGLSVPRELAVTGLFNTPWATESPVPLTTVDMGADSIAQRAAALVAGERRQEAPFIVPPRLIVRASCGSGTSIEPPPSVRQAPG